MKRRDSFAALVVLLGIGAVTAVPAVLSAQETTAPAETAAPEAVTPVRMGNGPMRGMFDFAEVDADKDGKITPEEMQAFRAAEIAGLDADGDGLITEAELAAHITAQMSERAAEMAKQRIAAHDTDGDGALSAAEMSQPPMPVGMFGRLDADGDGAVSQEEVDSARDRMADRMNGRGDHGGRGDHEGRGGWFGKRHGMMDN